jgi:hypothetical protein
MFTRPDLEAALKRLAGTERVVIYDVHEDDAPERPSPASPFIRGSAAWWDFVARRRVLDDGENLTLLVSMRGLRTEERLMVVNWGSAFANTFLLIEPSDPWLDLTSSDCVRQLAKRPLTRAMPIAWYGPLCRLGLLVHQPRRRDREPPRDPEPGRPGLDPLAGDVGQAPRRSANRITCLHSRC